MTGLRDRLLAGIGLAAVAAGFALLNGSARVPVNLGLLRFDSVSVPVIVSVAFVAGMLTLFLVGLKAELRTQRMLRRYREELGRPDGEPAPDEA